MRTNPILDRAMTTAEQGSPQPISTVGSGHNTSQILKKIMASKYTEEEVAVIHNKQSPGTFTLKINPCMVHGSLQPIFVRFIPK